MRSTKAPNENAYKYAKFAAAVNPVSWTHILSHITDTASWKFHYLVIN